MVVLLAMIILFYNLFNGSVESPVELSEPAELQLVVGGDIYFGERIKNQLNQQGIGLFTEQLEGIIGGADLKLVNLEAPITDHREPWIDKRYHLRQSSEQVIPLLQELGVDGVSLANNHIMDYGTVGLLDTIQQLQKAGIKYSGAGTSRQQAETAALFRRRGKKIGFLAFSNTFPEAFWADDESPGAAFGAFDRVRKLVAETARIADYTIVSFHWGRELEITPQAYQKNLGRAAIDAGATVVFGHHPHTLQPVEYYNDGVIFYSLGNYFFTTLSQNVQYGLVPRITLSNGGLSAVSYNLLNVNNYQVNYRPQPVVTFNTTDELNNYLQQTEKFATWDRAVYSVALSAED